MRLESSDAGLESLKKAAIDAVIRDPDLDVAALNYHLMSSGLAEKVAELSGEEMKARLGFDPASLSGEDAVGNWKSSQTRQRKIRVFSTTQTPKCRGQRAADRAGALGAKQPAPRPLAAAGPRMVDRR